MTYQKSPEQIQDEIAETRARMDARLSNITEQASPTTIAAKMLNMDTSSSGDIISTIVDRVKSNPLAALTIGAGLLGISKTDDRNTHTMSNERRTGANFIAGDPARRLRERSASLRDDAESAVDSAKQRASEHARTVANNASRLGDDAKNRFDDLQSGASDLTDKMAQRAREAPQRAKYEAENAAAWVKENPVPASLMALAAGAAIASFLAPKKPANAHIRDNRALVPEEDELTVKKAVTRKRKASKPAAKTRTATANTSRKPRAVRPAAASVKSATRSTTKRTAPKTTTTKPLDEIFTDK